MAVSLLVFIIGPRTAVIVGYKQYAPIVADVEPSHDIADRQLIAIKGTDNGILHYNRVTAMARELIGKKFSTRAMGLGTRHTRAHLHLPAHILISAVSPEFGPKLRSRCGSGLDLSFSLTGFG